jgi:hypothetical protein
MRVCTCPLSAVSKVVMAWSVQAWANGDNRLLLDRCNVATYTGSLSFSPLFAFPIHSIHFVIAPADIPGNGEAIIFVGSVSQSIDVSGNGVYARLDVCARARCAAERGHHHLAPRDLLPDRHVRRLFGQPLHDRAGDLLCA